MNTNYSQWPTCYEATSRVSMFQNSYHMFNFDCEFTHVSHVWPDRKLNGKSNGSCCKVIGATTIKLSPI